jgi:hypothetical protein
MPDDNQSAVRNRFRMPISHPVLCELTINVMKWYRFQQLNDNTQETNIIGYNEPVDGEITVFVACASTDVAKALKDGWD